VFYLISLFALLVVVVALVITGWWCYEFAHPELHSLLVVELPCRLHPRLRVHRRAFADNSNSVGGANVLYS